MRAGSPQREQQEKPRTELEGALGTLARGAAWAFVGRIVGTGLRYVGHVGVARLFGVEAFGLFMLGLGVYQFLELVASLGLVQGIVRQAAIFRHRGDRERLHGLVRAGRGLTLLAGSLLGFGLLLGAAPLAGAFREPLLGDVLRTFALALPFGAAAGVLASYTTAFETTRYLILTRELAQPGAFLVGLGLCAGLDCGLPDVALAWGLAALGAFLLIHGFLRVLLTPHPTTRGASEWAGLLRSSWPLWLASLSGFALLWTDTFLLGYFRTAEEVGVYRAAVQTALLLSLPLTALNAIFSPMIAALHHAGELDKLARLFKTTARWSLSLTAPGFLLVALYGQAILTLFGETFAQGQVPLLILAGAQLISAATGSVGFALIMSGRTISYLRGDFALVGVNLLLNLVLIPRWGALGAAWATGLSVAGVNLLRLWQVHRALGFHPFERAYLRTVGVVILGLLSGWGLSALVPGTLGPAVLLVLLYAVALYGLGLCPEDRRTLHGLLKGERSNRSA